MKRLLLSPAIRTAGVYGAAGAGFALANLILARALPPDEYALITLILALVNVGYSLAPVGIDGIVNRRQLEAGPRLLQQVLLVTTGVGILFALIAALAYDTSPPFTAMVFVSTVAGGMLVVAAAKFQSEQRFGVSLALIQSPNLILLLAAVITIAAGVKEAWLSLLIMTVGWFPVVLWGWWVLFRERHGKAERSVEFPWGEALSIAGVATTGLILVQLERLVLPYVLPLGDLATYGVLSAIVGSLFRVLQMGVGYTLVPQLRAATTVPQRRRLVAKEARTVGTVVLLGSAGIGMVTPLVERWFLAGKYQLSAALVVAALVSGISKVINSFTRATASALATQRELAIVSVLGWVSLVIGAAAAVVGAHWGLAGVIYGVALGWTVRSISAFYVAARHLRLSPAEQAVGPATTA